MEAAASEGDAGLGAGVLTGERDGSAPRGDFSALATPAMPWRSLVSGAITGSDEERELQRRLLVRYWKPIMAEIRWGWKRDLDEASALTRIFVWEQINRSGQGVGETGFRHHLAGQLEAFRPRVEGGALPRASKSEIDAALPPALMVEAAALAASPEDSLTTFEWNWIVLTLRRALRELEQDLERSGDEQSLEIFARRDLRGDAADPAALAAELDLAADQYRRRLDAVRRRYRQLVSLQIDEYALDAAEARRELDWMLS